MQIKSRGIVLSETPYNDRFSIVRVLTPSEGIVAYKVPFPTGRRSGANTLRQVLYPMSEVQFLAEHRNGRSVQRMIEASPAPLRYQILMQPEKRNIALFLADLLRLMLPKQTDEPMFDFVSDALEHLEATESSISIANYPIAFVRALLDFIGIAPNYTPLDVADGVWFSLEEADFIPFSRSASDINPQEAPFIPTLLRINYRNMHLYRFTGAQRRHILAAMLDFIRFHWIAFPALKSTDVLTELYER